MFKDMTGFHGLAGCRAGYSDCASFGEGFVARDTWSGCLDAPDFMPQGSVRIHNTMRHCPQLSMANRDALAGCAKPGTGYDGPESAAADLYPDMCLPRS